MLKIRIGLLVTAVAFIFLLFSLPRIIVKTNSESETGAISPNTSESILDFSPSDLEELTGLREKFKNSESKEKSAIFADSLAARYAEKGIYDSAAWYFGWIADHTDDVPAALKAGNFYYEAFETAPTPEEANKYGGKARSYLEQYLQMDPKDADAKAKVAMTYVATENAMKGIAMLREVVEEHPEHEEALFNLGILSIQINQFQKAVERLEKLIELNPGHVNAHFYLGIGYMGLKRDDAARKEFLKAKELSTEPGVHAAVENYLEQLKNK